MRTKILIVTNLFPNRAEPNRGVYIRQLAERLCTDFEIQVVAPVPWLPRWVARKWRPSADVPFTESIGEIKVYHPRYFVIPKVARFTHGLTFAWQLRQLVRQIRSEFQFHLVSVHWMFPDTFGTVLALKSGSTPIVAHALGCDVNDYLQYHIRRRMIRWALLRTRAVITKSDEIATKIAGLGIDAKLIHPIYNGVDRDTFTQRAHGLHQSSNLFPEDKRVILFIGNFAIEKGISYLLQAFAAIRRSRNDIVLCLIGSGPLRQAVEQETIEMGLGNSTRFLGQVAHELVPKFLKQASVLCLPSLREGCPNVVLESLACGTPVAASEVGAIPSMAEKSNICFLSKPTDVAALQENILRAIDLPTGIDRSFDWPSWEDNASAVARVFQQVLDSEQGTSD